MEVLTERKMTNIRLGLLFLFCFQSPVTAGIVSSSGRLTQYVEEFNNKLIQSVTAVTYPNVSATKCFTLNPAGSTSDFFFYNQNEATCVTCPLPCQQANLVDELGYRLFRPPHLSSCPTQKGYTHYVNSSGTCIKLHWDVKRLWAEAEMFCRLDGGHLMYINSQAEFDDLKDFVTISYSTNPDLGDNYGWLGASYQATDRVWLWTDGSPATLTNWWEAGQPTNGPGEDFVLIIPEQLKLHDAYDHRTFYFCEIDLI